MLNILPSTPQPWQPLCRSIYSTLSKRNLVSHIYLVSLRVLGVELFGVDVSEQSSKPLHGQTILQTTAWWIWRWHLRLVAHITRNFYGRKNLRFQLKYLVQKILDTSGCFCPYMAPARFMKPCAPSHICDKHSHTVGSSLESVLSPQIFKLARQPMPSQKYRYWLQLTCGKCSTAWWLAGKAKKVPDEGPKWVKDRKAPDKRILRSNSVPSKVRNCAIQPEHLRCETYSCALAIFQI